MSHHPTVEARDTTARTSLRLLTVLNVLFKYACAPFSSARLAPRPDAALTHFASPRGEKCRLVAERFAGFQNVAYALLRSLFPTEAEEGFFLQTEQIVL